MGVPPLVVVPDAPEDADTIENWLAVLRAGPRRWPRCRPPPAPWPTSSGGRASGRYRVERSVNPSARAGRGVEIRFPAARGQEGPAGDGLPQRRRGVHPAPAEASR